MKRIGFLAALLLLLFSTSYTVAVRPVGFPTENAALSELPWSTVSAVLKKVALQGTYSYEQLVNWYDQGLVSVGVYGTGYIVKIYLEDGLTDVILIDTI